MGSRAYCWTWNNPTLEPNELITTLKPVARYLVFQLEVGETDGTEHYQGYIELYKTTRIAALKKLVKEIHWESRGGTPEQARDYCMKEDTRIEGPWEYGAWSSKRGGQGKRTDLDQFARKVLSGATNKELYEEDPGKYLLYKRRITDLRAGKADEKSPPWRDMDVVVLYGEPGLGKTKRCYEFDPELYEVPVGKDLWFDGYTGQKTLLMDDFSGQMKLSDLLRVLDGYPKQVPRKGGFVWLHCTNIAITTNVHPDSWYDYATRQSSRDALKRRISRLLHFTDKDEWDVLQW